MEPLGGASAGQKNTPIASQAVRLFGMSLAHVMRQTRRVGDEERGHWLMSCLPNAPPLSLRGTFAPVRGKVHWS